MNDQSPDRSRRVAEIFDRLLDIPDEKLDDELDRLCEGDETLRAEVRKLLSADRTQGADTYIRAKLSTHRRALSSEEDVIGSMIGPYTVKSVIGRGGMGVVYFGVREDEQFVQRAAVKIIKRGIDTDEVIKRFNLERQVLNALNHPNIARLYDGGTTEDGRPYFAMEYIEGLPISRYCDNNRLSTRERLDLFRKVCDAVQYAHQNLIVHRDIKPSNIIVNAQGEPKLLDFGIAKMLNAPLVRAHAATGNMMRLMTPEYASPEQVRGDPVGAGSDVYSLGVLLYELLTGRRPYRFTKNVEHEIARVICEVNPERPSTAATHFGTIDKEDGTSEEVAPEKFASVREGEPSRLKRALRGDIDVIVLKALEKTTSRRYASAQLFSDDIVNYLSGMPIRARPASSLYKARKFVKRNRAIVGSLAAVFLALLVGAVATTWQWQRAEEGRLAATEASERAQLTADTAVDLAHDLVTELPGVLNSLAGSIEARQRVSELAIEYLEKLQKIPGVELTNNHLFSMSTSYYELGRLFDSRRQSSLGDTQKATVCYDKALELRKSLVETDPGNPTYLTALGESYIDRADMYEKTGDTETAIEQYELAIAALDQVVGTPEEELSAVLRRNGAHEGVAKIAFGKGDYERALELRQENLQRRADAVATLDADTAIRRRLQTIRNHAGGHIDVAISLRALGRYEEAEQELREALEIRRNLVRLAGPGGARYLRDLAYTINDLATLFLETGRPERALDEAGRAVEIMRPLYDAEQASAQPSTRINLFFAELLANQSQAARAAERFEEALAHSEEAVSLTAERLAVTTATDTQSLRYHVAAQLQRGLALSALDRHESAIETLESATNAIEPLTNSDPLNTRAGFLNIECRAALAEALVDLAVSLQGFEAERRAERAASSIRRATSILDGYRDREIPIPPDIQRVADSLAELRDRIGSLTGG